MDKSVKLKQNGFRKRLGSMLRVDFRRALHSKLFYIMIACALLVPIIMTVMLTMMDGKETVNQQTGEVSIMKGPENAWESIGTLPSDEGMNGDMAAMGGMDIMAMCNINMAFMGVAVFVCLFISDDFRSGYAKNLFAVRSKRSEYAASKTIVGFLCGVLMLIAYLIGAMLAGAIAGLSFDIGSLNVGNIVMCMLAKIFLMLVFVPIFVLVSVAAKQKAWLSICGSLGAGMLLFMMVGMITPLSSTIMNVILCAVGGVLFSVGLGVVSQKILNRSSIL